jgi:hypothetical protein
LQLGICIRLHGLGVWETRQLLTPISP